MKRDLTTARLRLREPRAGDAAHVFCRWTADAGLLRYLGWPVHGEVEQTRQMLSWDSARWLKRTAFTWMLLAGDLPGPVGQVQLVPQQLDGRAHHLRLGYVLARSHHGRGLMREAVAAVLDHAFEQAHVWRVDALCDVDNAASAGLLERLGLRREGRLARHALHPNAGAQPRDVWLYACTRETWTTPQPCTATMTE